MSLDDVAARVLDLVRAATSEAEAEALVEGGELALTRFANSVIHQNVADATTTVRLRLHVDGRTAAGSATIAGGLAAGDGEALGRLVDRTVAAARLAPLDPQWPGLAPAAPVEPLPATDEATADADPAQRAARVRDFVAAAEGLETAGYCSTIRLATAFANSAGMSASSVTAMAAMDAIARSNGADGVARLASSRLADVDGGRLGARAAAKARSGAQARELPPGRYEVVLEPTAVLDLLENLAYWGFNGKAVNEGRSFVEVGAAQFDPSVSIVDDPFDPRGIGASFDMEGTPKVRRLLVDAGVSAALAYDRRSGAQAGAASTGHALPGAAAFGAVATHVQLLPSASDGSGAPYGADDSDRTSLGPMADGSVAALVSQVGRGLLVSDFWYTRVLDPRTLVITGLTRNGVWLIEDGVVTAPVQNFRFTQSYPQALAAGAVLGIGSQSVGLPSGWDAICTRAPALRLAAWNFTGNPSG
jgi:predicted Zn-dependent protease